MVGVHLEDTADALFLAGTRVIDIRTCLQLAAIHTEIAETTHIRVSGNLECQCAQRVIITRLAADRLVCTRIHAIHLGSIQRTRQVCAYGVKHRLHTFVLEGRTADNREDMHLDSTLSDSSANLFLRDGGRVGEILLHQCIVELSAGVQHLVAPFLSLFEQVGRNLFLHILSTHRLVVPQDSLHLHQVNHTLECLLAPDRDLDRARGSTQHLFNLANHIKEIGTRAVHLVHVAQAWYGLRLRLHATYGAQCHHSTVQDTQRTLHLDGEVHVPRSVYQVDFVLIAKISPICSRSSRSDGDTALLLLLHPVHCCRTVVHLTDFVSQTGVEQYTFRSSRLTGIDVRHDADVSVQF